MGIKIIFVNKIKRSLSLILHRSLSLISAHYRQVGTRLNRHIPDHVEPNGSFVHCNIQSGEMFVFIDNLCTYITYPTNLLIRWDGSFCAIVVRLRKERLFRFINFISQPLLATNLAFNSSFSPHFSS